MNKKTKIIILISLCILIAIIGIYFLFPKGSNTQNIYVQKVSTIIGSSNTENRYSGVGPEAGIFTAIVAGFVISALGGSSVQIAGPTAAFATTVAGIVAHDGMDGDANAS